MTNTCPTCRSLLAERDMLAAQVQYVLEAIKAPDGWPVTMAIKAYVAAMESKE